MKNRTIIIALVLFAHQISAQISSIQSLIDSIYPQSEVFSLAVELFKIETVTSLDSYSQELAIKKALLYLSVSEITKAKIVTEKILSKYHSNPTLYFIRAHCNMLNSNYYEALKDLNMILKIDNNNAEAKFYRGTINFEIKDIEAGLSDLNSVIKDNNDLEFMLRAYEAIARYRIRNNQSREGLKLLDIMIKLDPKNPLAYKARAYYYNKQKKEALAFAYYKKCIELGGNAYKETAELALFYSKPFEAMQLCNTGLELFVTDSVDLLILRGISKFELEDSRGAISDYNTGLKIEPENYRLFFHRGNAKLLLGDINGACMDYSKSGQLGNQDVYKVIRRECR